MDKAQFVLRIAHGGAERLNALHTRVYAKGQTRMNIFDCFG